MTADEFWASLLKQPDGCWVWTGARVAKGYGTCQVNGVKRQAHRVAYELAHGRIGPGLMVCHKCDNPPCCNPEHLFLGSAKDNVLDKLAKARERAGIPRVCARGHLLQPSNCLRCAADFASRQLAEQAPRASPETPAVEDAA